MEFYDLLLVVSKSVTQHVEHIGKVLRQYGEANLQLKSQKCKLAQHEVEYLEHILTSKEVHLNDRNTRAIRTRTVKEVKSFLGLATTDSPH